jgi:hypothetical protein
MHAGKIPCLDLRSSPSAAVFLTQVAKQLCKAFGGLIALVTFSLLQKLETFAHPSLIKTMLTCHHTPLQKPVGEPSRNIPPMWRMLKVALHRTLITNQAFGHDSNSLN